MGLPSKPGTRGKYFLQTRGEAPFGLGVEGLTYKDGSLVRNFLGGK